MTEFNFNDWGLKVSGGYIFLVLNYLTFYNLFLDLNLVDELFFKTFQVFTILHILMNCCIAIHLNKSILFHDNTRFRFYICWVAILTLNLLFGFFILFKLDVNGIIIFILNMLELSYFMWAVQKMY